MSSSTNADTSSGALERHLLAARDRVRAFWPLFIGGEEVHAGTGLAFPVEDPATGKRLCEVSRGGAREIDLAVKAARAALPAWSAMPTARRAQILIDAADRMAASADDLALVECLSNGKPLSEARTDVLRSADGFRFYAGFVDKMFGTTIPISPAFLNYTVREPVGVTAHIAPWNYPLRLAMRSVAPALAAGNTVVLKPSEETPLSALYAARILLEAGVPAGVFNVVAGFGDEAGQALAGHPDVNQISFTGSVETGVKVMCRAAANIVPVTLELGGKSPNIVFADADIDAAVAGALKAIFSNAGQVCCAGSRLLLDRAIYDRFLERLVEATKKLTVGPGLGEPDMGPLISERQRTSVLAYVDLAKQEGGEIILGGSIPDSPSCKLGYFVEPTLVCRLSNEARASQEEIFGPVLTILRFDGDDEAVRIANDSSYGLVAGIWTESLRRAHKVAQQLRVGQVYVNDFFNGTVASPFGGFKKSGFGRERGLEALEHYTQVKSVCLTLAR